YTVRELRPDELDALESHLNHDHLGEEDRQRLRRQLVKAEFQGFVSADPDDVLARAQKADRGPDKADQAAEWLLKLLEKYASPAKEVIQAAEGAGFTRNTMFAAKKKLEPRVKASNRGRFGGEWHWGLGDPNQWAIRPDQPGGEWAVFPADSDTQGGEP